MPKSANTFIVSIHTNPGHLNISLNKQIFISCHLRNKDLLFIIVDVYLFSNEMFVRQCLFGFFVYLSAERDIGEVLEGGNIWISHKIHCSSPIIVF